MIIIVYSFHSIFYCSERNKKSTNSWMEKKVNKNDLHFFALETARLIAIKKNTERHVKWQFASGFDTMWLCENKSASWLILYLNKTKSQMNHITLIIITVSMWQNDYCVNMFYILRHFKRDFRNIISLSFQTMFFLFFESPEVHFICGANNNNNKKRRQRQQ